jgi:hypothetical protein
MYAGPESLFPRPTSDVQNGDEGPIDVRLGSIRFNHRTGNRIAR